jgi:hypothetical protein
MIDAMRCLGQTRSTVKYFSSGALVHHKPIHRLGIFSFELPEMACIRSPWAVTCAKVNALSYLDAHYEVDSMVRLANFRT